MSDCIDTRETIADLARNAAVDALRDEISRFHAIGMALVNLTEDADGMQDIRYLGQQMGKHVSAAYDALDALDRGVP